MKILFTLALSAFIFASCHHGPGKSAGNMPKDSLAKADSIKQAAPYVFDKEKPYPFSTGMVIYKYTGDYQGTQTLYFRNFGKEQRVEDSFINLKSPFQKLTHQVFISDGAKFYFIDLQKKSGYYVQKTDTTNKLQGNLLSEMSVNGIEKTMLKNGYNLKGVEDISGKKCRVYASGDSKFCFYNGINIKTDMLGSDFKYTLQAVKIQDNAVIPDNLFYPEPAIKLLEYNQYVKSQTKDKL